VLEYCVAYDESGFTDQIMQYYLAAKILGRMRGQYRHTPFRTNRNGKEAWELLGIEQAFRDRLTGNEERTRIVPIDLGTALVHATRYDQVEAAIGALHASDPSAILCVDVRPVRRKLIGLIDAEYERFPTEPDEFLAGFARTWCAEERDLPIRKDALNVMVHIRLGDAWESALPSGGAICVRDAELLPSRKQASVGEIVAFLSAILGGLPPNALNLLVFSDGLARAREALRLRQSEFGRADATHLDGAIDVDEAMLATLDTLPNTTAFIGEEPHLLRKLCAALFRCDVVIAFGYQRFCAKALVFFGGDRVRQRYFEVSHELAPSESLVQTLLRHKAEAESLTLSCDAAPRIIATLKATLR